MKKHILGAHMITQPNWTVKSLVQAINSYPQLLSLAKSVRDCYEDDTLHGSSCESLYYQATEAIKASESEV